MQIRYKVKQDGQTIVTPKNPDSEGWSTNMPTSGVIYMTQKLSNATAWSTPIQITGKDGDPGKDGSDIEYVYYRCNTTTFNTKPTGNITATPPKNDTWTTSPNGVTESQQYEYVSVRTKQAGATSFGPWSTPTIWSKWGEKGQDGDGVEYLYCLKQTKDAPTVTTKWHNAWSESTLPGGWTDEPTGTSEAYPYEYVVQIKSTDTTEKEFTGKLWGVYDGMLALYAKSTGMPGTPTGEGSIASLSENTTWQKDMPTNLTETQVIYASYKTFLGTSWSSPVKIYAIDGRDGTSISIKGTADSVALVEGETNKFTLIYNNTIVKQGTLGDGYIYNGDLYVCVTVNDTGDYFENVGAIKGDTGAHIIGIETYYYVTCNTNPFRDSNGNPLESPGGYGIEEPPENTSEWANDIKSISWGDKYAFDKTTQVTTSEKAAYIYQYLWVREKFTYSDHTEEHPHIEWNNPRLDASNTTIGNWCYENDKTLINGGTIATGTVTAKQIDATNLHVQAANVDGTLTAQQIDATNLHVQAANVDGQLTAEQIDATGITATGVDITGKVVATRGTIGSWELLNLGAQNNVPGAYLKSANSDVGIFTATSNLGGNEIINFWAGYDKSKNITDGSYQMPNINNTEPPNFFVTNKGQLKAENADISGNIQANTGKIGNLSIVKNGLASKGFLIYANDSGKGEIIIRDGTGRDSFYITDNQIGMLNAGSLEFSYDSPSTLVNYYAELTLVGDGMAASWWFVTVYNNSNEKTPLNLEQDKSFTFIGKDWFRSIEYTITIPRGESQGSCNVVSPIGKIREYYFADSQTNTLKFVQSKKIQSSGKIYVNGSLDPTSNAGGIGNTSNPWPLGAFTNLYVKGLPVSASDKNKKNSIQAIDEKYSLLFDNLNPVTFKFNDGTSDRTHIGLIAQEVKEAAETVGLTTQEVAAYCEWEEGDTTTCGVRYGELISLNIYEIQKLKARVKELEDKLSTVQND